MSRFDTAYLEVEDNQGTATFEFHTGLQTTGQLDKNYLMGERGQYIQEIYDQSDSIGEMDSSAQRRAGFWLDGGAGNYSETVTFETGLDDVEWGDGTGGTGKDNVTPRDASGPDVKPLTRYHVLSLWLTRTLTDSRNPARFYYGEWTDGNQAEHSEAGAFNQPFPCAVTNWNPDTQDAYDDRSVASMEGTLELSMLVPFGSYDPPSWMADSNVGTFIEHVGEQLGVIQDA